MKNITENILKRKINALVSQTNHVVTRRCFASPAESVRETDNRLLRCAKSDYLNTHSLCLILVVEGVLLSMVLKRSARQLVSG